MKVGAGLTIQVLVLAWSGLLFGCKQPSSSNTMGAFDNQQQNSAKQANTNVTPTPVASLKPRNLLSATEWLTKKNISDEEARTVDALLESISTMEGKSGSAESLARWAEGGLRIVLLDGKNLTNISPILVFKNISTLHITGNRFAQPQIDELLKGLPKLKVLALDPGLSCSANPKVNCLY
ncbi:MAG: hypothetical protein RI953_2650 [Pseudomonadota bacterium]|jgi:hypothetical protein